MGHRSFFENFTPPRHRHHHHRSCKCHQCCPPKHECCEPKPCHQSSCDD